MKVLIVGSGGREHALAWCIARSQSVDVVHVAPGNPGTAAEPKVSNVALDISDFESLTKLVAQDKVDLTIVGPEQPIADGIREYFDQKGLKCFAPTSAAGKLESSKSFAKAFMERHNIPTAKAIATQSFEEAADYIADHGAPIVVKADGLAAGKGVLVATTVDQAISTSKDMLAGKSFGESGTTVVIEDFLDGEEASFIVMSDGENVIPFASSQDHKPVFDNDKGPNTGGMGAYSPAPVVSKSIAQKVMERIVQPTITGMVYENNPFQGFLYVGLMICDSEPYVVEYNCRFGDPEAQPVLMRLESDLADFCIRALDGDLNEQLEFKKESAVAVVLASSGYPGTYETGLRIEGLDREEAETKVFHAGTVRQGDEIVTSGGRVLTVVGLGSNVKQARDRAYDRARRIRWPNVHMRNDIAHRAIERLQ